MSMGNRAGRNITKWEGHPEQGIASNGRCLLEHVKVLLLIELTNYAPKIHKIQAPKLSNNNHQQRQIELILPSRRISSSFNLSRSMAHPLFLPAKYPFYPIGNTSAVCFTRDLAPEGPADILLLGCGDPRSILYTIFSEPSIGP